GMRTRFLVLAAVAVAVVVLAPARASAHDLRAKVTVGGDTVRVEVGFDDDTPAEKATVTVTDATGAEVAAGKTDGRGVWSFPRPAPGRYTLKATAIGHVDQVPF